MLPSSSSPSTLPYLPLSFPLPRPTNGSHKALPTPPLILVGVAPPQVLAPLWPFPHIHYLYVPFFITELYNWKNRPPFSTSPHSLVSLIDSPFQSFPHVRWLSADYLYALHYQRTEINFFDITSMVDDQMSEVIDHALPRRPQWDNNTEKGRSILCECHQILLEGMKRAAQMFTKLRCVD